MKAIADEYLAALLARQPEMGTLYGLPDARHDDLRDNSLEALRAWQTREDVWLAELDALGAPEAGSRDRVTYATLREALAGSIAYRVCRTELWSAGSATAWPTSVTVLFELQPVETPEQRQQAVARLARLAEYVDVEIENLREGLALGYSAPRQIVPAVIEESRRLLAEGSPLLSPAMRAGDDPAFAAQLRKVFETQVTPAIERYARFLEETYLPRAREEISIAANPSGADCYPVAVRHFATVDPGGERIHALGLEQIAGIRAEMQQIVDAEFPGESIESAMILVTSDPRYTFDTREAVIDYSAHALARARAKMPEAFGRLPDAAVEIRPYPSYREDSGTGEYLSSSQDGTRPGIYYIAVRNPQQRSIAGQQSVLYHETYPGHHLQGAIALELGDRVHPLSRYLWNAGYGEGWALYSERLADELGLYSAPLDRLGMLSDQAARAARLVVDSGLHTRGWSRQRAVDYMRANTAWAPVDIEVEIDRYIAWPGQATAYMLGMLEIRRLRERAERELGPRFDLRDFHDRLLENGCVPLALLGESIETWIAASR